MKFRTMVPAVIAALVVGAPFASADDMDKGPDAPPSVSADGRVLVFGDGAARFNVVRDASAGTMTFRLADPSVKVTSAPVIVATTPTGPREIALTSVEPGVWRWSDPTLVRAASFDGTMRVIVDGKTYTSPLATVWTTETTTADGWAREPGGVKVVARYGGRVLPLADCGAAVEVVQDPATGTITIYSFEDVVITEAPVITITESKGPSTVTLTRVEGKNGVWMTKHESFKTTTTSATIRLLVNGKSCEAPIFGSRRGGQVVTVAGGPSFEVVRDPKAGYYTFYAVDETIDGKAYTVENPVVVVDGRTYNLTRVEGEPRAWRLVGLDNAGSDARNAQLNFTLFGKTLSTRVGLSGLGVGVK